MRYGFNRGRPGLLPLNRAYGIPRAVLFHRFFPKTLPQAHDSPQKQLHESGRLVHLYPYFLLLATDPHGNTRTKQHWGFFREAMTIFVRRSPPRSSGRSY